MTVAGRPNLRQQSRRNLLQHSPANAANWWRWCVAGVARLFAGSTAAEDTPDKFFDNLDTDVLITFGTNRQSLAAIRSVDRSLLCIASDADVDPSIANDSISTTNYGEPAEIVKATIREASIIVSQNERQRVRLAEHFNRDCLLIRNPIDLLWWTDRLNEDIESRRNPRVLWIGRADRHHKRPLLAIEAARRTPGLEWTMIVNRGDASVAAEITKTVSKNVTLINSVSFDQMPRVMSDHDIFVTTAEPEAEGFPNVLLQAAASRLPIVSLGSGAQFLQRSGAGTVVGSLDDLVRVLEEVKSGSSHTLIDHTAVYQFLEANYSSDVIADAFVRIIQST